MFNWFQRLLPRKGDFFGMFESHARTLVASATALTAMVEGSSPRDVQIQEITNREHEADEIIRQVLRSVRQTFLTPFDRGEIIALISAMDDAVDEIHAMARTVNVYDLGSFEPEMKQMATIIAEQAHLTAEALPLMRNISKNGARIHGITERVVRLEGEGDEVHARGLKRAFLQLSGTPMEFMVQREIYKQLERITDALEDVANVIDGIVIDHA